MKITAFVLVILVLATIACAAPVTPPPAAATAPVKAKEAPRSAWDDTLAAAKQEGKVVLINRFPSGVRTAIGDAFKRKYGIDIEFIVATVPEEQPKIIAQRAAGLYLQDLVQAGATSHLDLKKAGLMAPIAPEMMLAEVKDPASWKDKRLPFQDQDQKIFMFLSRVGPTVLANKDQVNAGEIKSWRDLLAPKWKGKIALFDPTVGGPGNALMVSVDELMGRDYLKQLAKQEPVVSRDMRMQVEWVARGKYPLALGFEFTMMEEMRKTGAPVFHIVPAEGSYTGAATGSLGLFDRAAHPNAARLFLNWFLSKETQVQFTRETGEESRRADVPSILNPDRQVQPGMKYSDFDTDDFQARAIKLRTEARDIFLSPGK